MSETWTLQQQTAIDQVDTNLIVTAGAGSGKTATMIERAFRLIKGGVPVRRITMLTFTEKAATEMKEKLRVRLSKALREKTDPAEKEFLLEQLDELSYASICTIHSFCYSLVREYFEQIPLSPSVRILEGDTTCKYLKHKAFRRLVEQAQGEREFDLMRTMVGLRSDDNLEQLIRNLYEAMAIEPDRHRWLQETYDKQFGTDFDNTEAAKFVVAYYTKYMRFACEACRDMLVRYQDCMLAQKALRTLVSRYQAFETCQTYGDLVKAYEATKDVGGSIRLKGSPYYWEITPYKDLLGDLKTEFEKLLAAVGDEEEVLRHHRGSAPFVKTLFDLVVRFEALYDEEKRAMGGVDFDDLEKYTLYLLQEKGLQEEIRSRQDYVFVDEFQDINYLQSAIIDLISPPDRLFVVGDSKQSIYRFRLADPRIFLERVEQWEKDRHINLSDNFRSDNAILHFVNQLFGVLMTKDFGGVDYSMTDAFRLRNEKSQPNERVVQIYLIDKESETHKTVSGLYSVRANPAVREARSAEGEAIARYIRSHLGKTVTIKGQTRTLCYSDFAILFTTRNSGRNILLQLQKEGIPLNLNSFASDVGVHEIQQLLQYAYLLDNARQDYPLLCAMRSAFGGFDDEELATIRKSGDRYLPFWQVAQEYAKGESELAGRVADFLNETQRFRFAASFTPMATLLNDILSQTGYWDHLYTLPDGNKRVEALNSFLAQVSGAGYADSLSDFCEFYRANEPEDAKVRNAKADSVIVSTIHESKGLEYPVVIVAACGASAQPEIDAVNCDRELGVGTYYYDLDKHRRCATFAFQSNRLKKSLESREDKLRLLYVAATRAQCYLLLTGELSENTSASTLPVMCNRFVDWLQLARNKNPDLARYFVNEIEDGEQAIDLQAQEGEKLGEGFAEMLAYRYPYRDVTELAKKYTVTALNKQEGDDETPAVSFVDKEEYTTLGTAYHAVFEHIDYALPDKDALQHYLTTLQEEGILDSDIAKQLDVDAIWRCLQLPLLRQAAQANTLREQRFMLQCDAKELGLGVRQDVLIQGVIDLLIVSEKGVTLVDFKRSHRSKKALQEAYRVQLQLYAKAVEKAMGVAVNELLLVEIGRAMVVEINKDTD